MTEPRLLTCTTCHERIRVHEIPRPFIDPRRYVCGNCLKPKDTLTLLDQPTLEETRDYDPLLADIPY